MKTFAHRAEVSPGASKARVAASFVQQQGTTLQVDGICRLPGGLVQTALKLRQLPLQALRAVCGALDQRSGAQCHSSIDHDCSNKTSCLPQLPSPVHSQTSAAEERLRAPLIVQSGNNSEGKWSLVPDWHPAQLQQTQGTYEESSCSILSWAQNGPTLCQGQEEARQTWVSPRVTTDTLMRLAAMQ